MHFKSADHWHEMDSYLPLWQRYKCYGTNNSRFMANFSLRLNDNLW
jgi:hypothetical protein